MSTEMARCHECEGELVRKDYEHAEYVGSVWVIDRTAGSVLQCTRCGEPQLTMEQLAGYQRRALATVLRDGQCVAGPVFEAARHALGLNLEELARILKCAPAALGEWELFAVNVPGIARLALVALLYEVETGAVTMEELKSGQRPTDPRHLEVRPLKPRSTVVSPAA